MAADASIFAQYLRPVKSVADYGAEMDASQQNALQLAALKMKAQQDQQGFADEQTFRGLAQQHGNDQNALMRAAMSAGLYGKAQGIQKTIDEQLKAKADREKTGADTRKTDVETIDKSLATAKTFVNQVQDSQGAAAYLEGLYSDPVLGPLAQRMMPKEQAIANIPQDPQQLLRWKAGHMQITGDKLIDLLKPKTDITNMGGAQSFGATDQFSGQRTQTGSAPITQSADNAASQETARLKREQDAKDAAAGRAVQYSGQRIQRDRLEFEKGAAAADAGGPTQAALTKQFGKAEPGRRWKPDGTLEPIPGGSQDRKANEQQGGKETVDSVVAGLRSSYDALDKGGGITSTDQGAISNLGRRVSQSTVGQFAGGAVGGQNQKERDSIAQARPLLLQAIMKATGMSAKQMDSNAELKLYLATATDPTLSLQANREALDRIAELYGGGATPKQPSKPAGAGLSAQEQKELDELRARFGGRK